MLDELCRGALVRRATLLLLPLRPRLRLTRGVVRATFVHVTILSDPDMVLLTVRRKRF